MASVMSTVLSRLNAFLDSELEQVLCFDSAIDAEKFASEKSAIFLILPEEDTTKNFMAGLMIQNLSRELFVGWKAQVQGNKLVLNVGFSHPVEFLAPEGIKFECPSLTEISVSGISKELVGQTAANIRKVREPEPYHGYGIRYKGEYVEHKEGKTSGKSKK